MKNLFKKSTGILLLTLLMVIQTPVVFVQAATTSDQFQCEHLNNQSAAAQDKPATPTATNGGEGIPKTPTTSLNDKLVVITEEPLGTADGKTTHLCARQIICTGEEFKAPKPPTPAPTKTSGTTGKPATQPAPVEKTPPAPEKPTFKRVCKTTYVASSSCSATSKSDIDATLGKIPVAAGDGFTLCEPVMVYVSPAGTALLYYYIGQIYRYMATLGGTIAVLILIVGGIMRASAGDNPDRISKANDIITKCISGLALLFLSAIILYAINPNFFVI